MNFKRIISTCLLAAASATMIAPAGVQAASRDNYQPCPLQLKLLAGTFSRGASL